MVADAIRRVHALVTGAVQGVWFRKGAQHEARELGLTGWVRNRADGTVEFEAQGPRSDVEALLVWARLGTPGALVDQVAATDVPVSESDRAFEVRT